MQLRSKRIPDLEMRRDVEFMWWAGMPPRCSEWRYYVSGNEVSEEEYEIELARYKEKWRA